MVKRRKCVIHCHVHLVSKWHVQKPSFLHSVWSLVLGKMPLPGKDWAQTATLVWALLSAYLFGQITKLAIRPVPCCVHFNTQPQQSIKAAHLLVMLNTQGSVQGQVKEMFAAAESQARTDRAWYCSWLCCSSAGMCFDQRRRLHRKCVLFYQSVWPETSDRIWRWAVMLSSQGQLQKETTEPLQVVY